MQADSLLEIAAGAASEVGYIDLVTLLHFVVTMWNSEQSQLLSFHCL